MNRKWKIAIVFLLSFVINFLIIRFINNAKHLRADFIRNLTPFEVFKSRFIFTLVYDVKPAVIIAIIITLTFLVLMYFRSIGNTKHIRNGEMKMDLSKVFDEMKKNSIKLEFGTESNAALPIGASKFGGNPDVPKSFKWFYYEGESFDGETKNRPLSFLAQINCEEAAKYDEDGLLPKRGMLYFFYELATMTWGFDPSNKGCAKVFYFDGDVKELNRASFPEDMEEDYKLPELQIDFSKKYDLPSYEEFNDIHDYDNWDEYDEVRTLKGYEQEEVISKLLGYADVIQNSMLLECEEVAGGIYTGNIPKIEPEKLDKMKNNCNQWQLLFQMDTVTTDNFELMFGDCGRIYYYIKKDDLKNRNFDDCWLILQCY